MNTAASAQQYDTHPPDNGQLDRIAATLKLQRNAYLGDGFPSLKTRLDRLDRTIDLLDRNRNRFCEAISSDFGHRHPFQSSVTDILLTLESLKHCRKHTRRWMRPQRRPTRFPLGLLGARSRIAYQPLGVIGIMAPWNFPVQLCFSPLANALSAGNRAMIKPSELTPATSALMAELVTKAFDREEVAVITGGVEVAKHFSAQPFDHLVFTGSPAVAKQVMRAAAQNLVPLTLELGGKCPVIVGDGADLKMAVDRILTFKMLNAGQVCLAPDYVYLPPQAVDEFVALAKQKIRADYSEIEENEDFTSIIDVRSHKRISRYITEAAAKGCQTIALHPELGDGSESRRRKIPPTLILNLSDALKVMQDEIFGPVLPLKTYTDIQNVIADINRRERPLALYYFGRSQDEIRLFTRETTSGGMVINDVAAHVSQDTLPLGGIGNSGMGMYHGYDGFRQFSHGKALFKQGWISLSTFIRPPYKPSRLKLIQKFLG